MRCGKSSSPWALISLVRKTKRLVSIRRSTRPSLAESCPRRGTALQLEKGVNNNAGYQKTGQTDRSQKGDAAWNGNIPAGKWSDRNNCHLSQEKYEETLLFLYDFFICYTIIGQENSNKITNAIYKNSSILENHYSDSALECFISELKNKLPSKEVFLKAFSNLGWSHHAGYYDDDRNKERVQVVLEVLERYKCASKQCAAFTIEHILDDTNSPENGIDRKSVV